jgi:hypothetical protein
MALIVKDAVKHALKARIGLLAPTGGGKTYTGLRFLFAMVDAGMAKRVGVIDTEHGSASKYLNDPFPPFRVVEMSDDFSPEQYIEAMDLMARDGVDALLIDSLSHAWAGKGGSLELKDRFGKQKGFNDYTAWGPVSAMQNRLIEALLSYPGHLVATLRLKMEHVIEKDPVTGKNVVRKVGLQPVQRDGMEYEFDVVADLDQDHNFTVSKTRCRTLDGYSVNKPGEEVIRKLRGWLESGVREERPVPTNGATSAAPKPVAPDNISPSIAPAVVTSSTTEPAATSSTDPAVDPLLADIAKATSKADLDAIVPKVGALAEVPRSVVRAAWMAKLRQVRAA